MITGCTYLINDLADLKRQITSYQISKTHRIRKAEKDFSYHGDYLRLLCRLLYCILHELIFGIIVLSYFYLI